MKKFIENKIKELKEELNEGYLPNDIMVDKQARIERLEQLYFDLYGY